MFSEQQYEVSIKDYLHVVWKRRWLVFSVALAVMVSTIIAIGAKVPRFSATALILMEKETPMFGKEAAYSVYDTERFAQTQLRLMETDDFRYKVATELTRLAYLPKTQASDPDSDPYTKEPMHSVLSRIRMVSTFFKEKVDGAMETFSSEADRNAEQASNRAKGILPKYSVGRLKGSLDIKLIPRTDIIQVIAQDPSPEEASLIANTVAETFVKDRLGRRLGNMRQAVQWLQDQLKQEQTGLDSARIELYEFMQQYGILDMDEVRGTKLDEEIQILKEKAREASEKVDSLKLHYEQILALSKNPSQMDSIPEVATNELLKELKSEELKLEQESIKSSNTYGSNHPKIVALDKQLRNVREGKSRELQKVINSIKLQYDTAVIHYQSLINSQLRMENDKENLKKKTIRYYTLKREVDSGEKIYDVLLNRFKETSLSEEMSKGVNASLVQMALVPEAPSSPNVKVSLALGLFLAMALGIGLAFLLEYLDNTFTRPEQVEQNLGLTFLGAVPSLDAELYAKQNGDGRSLIALEGGRSSAAEAYRALRTSILLSSADVQPQVLLITSPGKGEGKTSTAANLATVMAQAGNRVVLIDCDLRKPRAHKVFGVNREPGVSNFLVSKEPTPGAFIQKSAQPNLEVIACGPIPPNPSELLGSKRMQLLLTYLRDNYDLVILDTPPVLAATDAAVLTPLVDGCVLVVRAGETRREMAQRAVKLLSDLNARMTGVVLNEISLGKNGYYYYDYYYYGQYYGDEEQPTGKRKKKRRRSSSHEDKGEEERTFT
jgi:polysaccharide biosynthesis transport protein